MRQLFFTVVALYWIALPTNAASSAASSEEDDQIQVVKCLKDDFACVGQGTSCNNGKCACGSDYVGRAHLACHAKGTKICSLFNDPKGKTFGGEPNLGIDIPLPCRYLLTDVITTSRNDDPDLNGQYQCSAQVFAVEKRIKGKFFVSGFEVILSTNRKTATGVVKGDFAYRAVGSAWNDVYYYYLDERQDLEGGYMGTVLLNNLNSKLGGDNVFAVDSEAQRVLFSVPRCGLEIYFRVGDEKLGKDQAYMPGLSLGVNAEDFHIVYNDLENTFCLTPNKNELTVSDVGTKLGLKDNLAFMFRAMNARPGQNFPGIASNSCNQVSDVINKLCIYPQSRHNAFVACEFILSHPRFAHCYSMQSDSGDLIALYGQCLEAYCLYDENMCRLVQRHIIATGCDFLAAPEFIGFDCNFMI